MHIFDYIPLMILFGLCVVVSTIIILIANYLGPSNPTKEKLIPYESGSDPIGSPSETRFSIKFYMVAISFILFDLEAVFVVPWAISWQQSQAVGHGLYSFAVMSIFVGILSLGLAYEWTQGGLEWD